jgi:glycogen(starch) synthase
VHVLITYLEDVTWAHPGHCLSREVYDISSALAQLGVSVTVLTVGREKDVTGQLEKNLQRLSAPLLRVIPVSRLKEMHLAALLQSNMSLLTKMVSRQFNDERFDVVHCFGWEAGLASGLICQITGAPLIFTIEDIIPEQKPWLNDPQLAYARYVERWLLRRCRGLLCPDKYMLKKIQDLFMIKEEDVAVVPPVSSLIQKDDDRGSISQQTGRKILFVGPLGPYRGVDDLLWACSQLICRQVDHVQLLLVTSASSAEDFLIRKKIRELHLAEHVIFLNQVDRTVTMEEMFRQVDLFVIPGRAEFVGNMVLDAIANGIPVVAADCGALAEMVEDGVTGLKFSFGDGQSLLAAMETALFDADFRSQIASQARREDRRWPEMAPLLLKIYQDACAGRGEPEGKGGQTDDLRLAGTRSGRRV